MLPLVRVCAAVSADVATSTKLFVMRYNITSLALNLEYCITQLLRLVSMHI